jgi:hypothetical protein
MCLAVPRIGAAAVVCLIAGTGTTTEGAEVELPYLSVVSMRGERSDLDENFALDQADQAFARYEEIARRAEKQLEPASQSDAAELSRRLDEAMLARDWDRVAALLASEVVRLDRRAGLGVECAGRENVVAENQLIAEAVQDVATTTTVASRSDRLVLQHKRATGAGAAAEFELLSLLETDGDGGISRMVWFDPNDVTSALAELDERYVAHLTQAEADAWQVTRAMADYYNARDRSGLRALLADDCVIVDERVTGWGTLDRDAFLDNLQLLVGMAPDASLTCVDVHAITPHGSVGRFRVSGTVPGGGEFEILFEITGVVRNGKLTRLELLPEGHVDDAIFRLGQAAG